MNYLMTFVNEFVNLFMEMAPYLMFGFLIAGVIHVWIPRSLYIHKLEKPTLSSVIWSAVFGVPLPICSCGVIPTAIALHKEGASKGASVSFLISTPATGVDSILATYSLLGLPFAILRPIAAFATSIFGGVLTNKFGDGKGCVPAVSVFEEHDHCEKSAALPKSVKEKFLETFRYGFVEMVENVTKWLMIGLIVGALISTFVPNEFFMPLREYSVLCMLAVLLLAMPMYTCATGSIPLALALVAKGITPGAALVLLMAGPATSVASMLVIRKAFGLRVMVTYLLSIATGALFFGFIVDTFFMDTFLNAMNLGNVANVVGSAAGSAVETPWHCQSIFSIVMAVFFALLILNAVVRGKALSHGSCNEPHCSCGEEHGLNYDEAVNYNYEEKREEEHVVTTYTVMGMNCNHCKHAVEKIARMFDTVKIAEANVHAKTLTIEGYVDEDALKKELDDAGFELKA